MFPNSDPAMTLELHRQKVAEMIREAADHELARTAGKGQHRHFGRWRSKRERGRGARVTAAA
jgi:hypothetical protein